MSSPLIVINSNFSPSIAIDKMPQNNVRHLLLVDKNDAIVSIASLIELFVEIVTSGLLIAFLNGVRGELGLNFRTVMRKRK